MFLSALRPDETIEMLLFAGLLIIKNSYLFTLKNIHAVSFVMMDLLSIGTWIWEPFVKIIQILIHPLKRLLIMSSSGYLYNLSY